MSAFHIVLAGGGTAGHLFPGLAVARHLAKMPDLQIAFAGSGRAWERGEVAAAGFAYLPLRCRPVPRRLGGVISFLVDNWAGFWAADRFLRTHPVRVVVGLGGYASVPMARAAVRRGIALVLLEQNAFPGRATRYLSRAATLICTSFAETSRLLTKARCPVCVTGNPIRPVVVQTSRRQRQMVILGGSGGAQTLNEAVPRALDRVRPLLAGWRIVHQTGERGLQQTRDLYRTLRIEAAVVPFISEMPGVVGQAGMSGLLAETDLAVCRAGGTTLAELASSSVPAILVPYPHAADGHQRKNAEVFAAAGACLIVDQRACPESLDCRLADAIAALVADPARRAAMAEAIQRLARPNAAADVACRISEIAGGVPRLPLTGTRPERYDRRPVIRS